MVIPSVYINLEDDVSKIATRLKAQKSKQVVLVCPKRCFLFSDSINLKLLKMQTDVLGKEVSILTMDEKGQAYATEAGFQLRFLPKVSTNKSFSDVKFTKKPVPEEQSEEPEEKAGILAVAASEMKQVAHSFGIGVPAELSSETTPEPEVRSVVSDPEVQITQTSFPAESELNYKKSPRKSHMQKVLLGTVAVPLVLILLLVFVILPKASVVVYPRTEPVTRDFTQVSMSVNAAEIDTSRLVIPAVKVDETLDTTAKFPSQGKKQVGNRASGTIKIYNFTGLPLNLKASTTVLTVGNQTYNLVNDISGLKPTTYKNARTKEVDESSLADPVEIVAVQGGEDSNLPAGTRMEITNKVFGSKPLLLYAKTDSEIKGGTTRYLSVISEDDLNAAKTLLQEQALAQLRQSLEAKGLVLADKAYNVTLAEFSVDNPAGTETPAFQGSLHSAIIGLAFKKEDLNNLITKRISETLSANKTLKVKNPEQTAYKIKSLDLTNMLAVLEVHFEGQAVFSLDLPYIAPELVGKSQNEANEILRSKAEVDKIVITLAPSWQKKFPLFASKIKVTVGSEDLPEK